jgi:hypothetical protein
VETNYDRDRVLLGKDVDRLDVVGLRHRAVDRDRELNRVAVLSELRHDQLHAALMDRGLAHDLLDRIGHLLGRGQRLGQGHRNQRHGQPAGDDGAAGRQSRMLKLVDRQRPVPSRWITCS